MRSAIPLFKIGLVQMSCSTDSDANLQKAIRRNSRGGGKGRGDRVFAGAVPIAVFLPRGECRRYSTWRRRYPGPSTEALGSVAKELQVSIVASLFEKRAPGLYHNTAAVLDADGSLIGLYRKMHIPDDPLYFEKFYFTPGDLGFQNFETRYSRIGVLVCWDQWYPEGARITSLQGANVLFYPTAIGWHPSEKAQYGEAQLDAWRTIQRAHAIANGVFVAAVNRTGYEGPPESGLEFWGNSFVADPFGRVLAQASANEEQVLVVECDPKQMDEVRRNWPFLRDRRIDAYAPITAALARLTDASWRTDCPLRWGSACLRNGSRTKRLGSRGRTRRRDWPGKFAPIPWVYGEIVRHLSRVERVRILVEDAERSRKHGAS